MKRNFKCSVVVFGSILCCTLGQGVLAMNVLSGLLGAPREHAHQEPMVLPVNKDALSHAPIPVKPVIPDVDYDPSQSLPVAPVAPARGIADAIKHALEAQGVGAKTPLDVKNAHSVAKPDYARFRIADLVSFLKQQAGRQQQFATATKELNERSLSLCLSVLSAFEALKKATFEAHRGFYDAQNGMWEKLKRAFWFGKTSEISPENETVEQKRLRKPTCDRVMEVMENAVGTGERTGRHDSALASIMFTFLNAMGLLGGGPRGATTLQYIQDALNARMNQPVVPTAPRLEGAQGLVDDYNVAYNAWKDRKAQLDNQLHMIEADILARKERTVCLAAELGALNRARPSSVGFGNGFGFGLLFGTSTLLCGEKAKRDAKTAEREKSLKEGELKNETATIAELEKEEQKLRLIMAKEQKAAEATRKARKVELCERIESQTQDRERLYEQAIHRSVGLQSGLVSFFEGMKNSFYNGNYLKPANIWAETKESRMQCTSIAKKMMNLATAFMRTTANELRGFETLDGVESDLLKGHRLDVNIDPVNQWLEDQARIKLLSLGKRNLVFLLLKVADYGTRIRNGMALVDLGARGIAKLTGCRDTSNVMAPPVISWIARFFSGAQIIAGNFVGGVAGAVVDKCMGTNTEAVAKEILDEGVVAAKTNANDAEKSAPAAPEPNALTNPMAVLSGSIASHVAIGKKHIVSAAVSAVANVATRGIFGILMSSGINCVTMRAVPMLGYCFGVAGLATGIWGVCATGACVIPIVLNTAAKLVEGATLREACTFAGSGGMNEICNNRFCGTN
ncbi:hypothetical protein FACS189449_11950 [Alphaproteobacteria bacterium]|nr:hypothetical protein FACS189449_11950 [Alphaproteobacteria bacterium]